MLNDQAYWLASNGDGLGTYKCRLCGNVSEWHFGIAPVAMLIYSAHTNDSANVPGVPAAAAHSESTNKPSPPIGTND